MDYPYNFIDESALSQEIVNAVWDFGDLSFCEWLEGLADPCRFGARISPSRSIPTSAEPFMAEAVANLKDFGLDVDIPNFLDECADLRAKQAVRDGFQYYFGMAIKAIIIEHVDACLEHRRPYIVEDVPMVEIVLDFVTSLIEDLAEKHLSEADRRHLAEQLMPLS